MILRPEILCHPNIPKPLHGINPRTIYGKSWWDNEREKVYRNQDYKCLVCGIEKIKAKYHKWLECHEMYDVNYNTGEVKFIELVALCHSCHNFIHSGRLKVLYQTGKISEQRYNDILDHGLKILRDNNLNKILTHECNASWDDWHLLMPDGKKYYSNFKDYEEWRNFYDR